MGWLRHLKLFLIMLMVTYPVIELCRVIILSGTTYYPEMWEWQLKVEIAFIGLGYLSIPFLYYWKVDK
jgi:hypothetical protein